VDTRRTLNELDPPDWGPAPPDATSVVTACHAARAKPFDQLNAEDLRVLIGQNVSLDLLVPAAITRLQENPLTESDLYPGDLLNAVLSVDPAFWRNNDDVALKVEMTVRSLESAIETLSDPIAHFRSTAWGVTADSS
jgi:CDI immunity proteins